MATLRKRLGKWEVRVRRCSNKTLSKTFLEKADADKWGSGYQGQKIMKNTLQKLYLLDSEVIGFRTHA